MADYGANYAKTRLCSLAVPQQLHIHDLRWQLKLKIRGANRRLNIKQQYTHLRHSGDIRDRMKNEVDRSERREQQVTIAGLRRKTHFLGLSKPIKSNGACSLSIIVVLNVGRGIIRRLKDKPGFENA